ncbi:MAG: 16S rRNA (cytidine(1402)-2'-O)-methyltransferase [Clostridiales bacterium]|nr:16S rRNA (cytidine(1402)-2'-O)-methyltransferase [Clostridiales bacterium]
MPVLYVVATPIGNLHDLSERAREILTNADLICAEDTRVTMKLTNSLGIKKPMISCHRHNEDVRVEPVIERMIAEDLTVALVSDAGTPAISDPGQILVDAAWKAGIQVIPVSGPCAAVTAISATGFDAREFAFVGFLPRERKPLREKLTALRKTGIPVIAAYESPHRVRDLIAEFGALYPECQVMASCDLTKKFELLLRGTPAEIVAKLDANPNSEKGEYTVVFDFSSLPKEEEVVQKKSAEEWILSALLEGLSFEDGVKRAHENCARNEVYKAKLAMLELFEAEDEDEE